MSFISILRTSGSEAPLEAAPLDATSFTTLCLAYCKRLPAIRRTAAAQRLDRLVGAGAFTDAALALIAIELPDWQLHRLACDQGEWHCALTRQPDMPDWLDDAAEGCHPDMTTAILDAFRKAMSLNNSPPLAATSLRPLPPANAELMSCENYA